MRVVRVIRPLAFVVLGFMCLIGYCRITSVYFGFKDRSEQYHADFAQACDSALAKYPLGTNEFISVPTQDPNLPKIIKDLHPEKIKLMKNWVWVLVKSSHTDGLAVIWDKEVLTITSGEGPMEVVYDRSLHRVH